MLFTTTQTTSTPKKKDSYVCPQCGKEGKSVKEETIKAQLLKEKREHLRSNMGSFHFCTSPECRVVYYNKRGDECFYEADIKAKVTIKNDDPATPLCYCHKYKKADALEDMKHLDPKALVKKIKAIISKDKSFCQKANPKGSCCTADIKSWLAERNIPWETSIKLAPVSKTAPIKTTCC